MNVIIATNKKQIIDHFHVRGEVFIKGQNIDWEIEFDGKDHEAILFTCYKDNTPVGAARLLNNKVGRVATISSYRKQGVGKAIMNAIEQYAKDNQIPQLVLNAQCYVEDFYKNLGYNPVGEIFLEADIEHIKMIKII